MISLSAFTKSITEGASLKCRYASSTSTIDPFGFFSTRYSMSEWSVRVPVGLFGLQT